MLPHESPLYSQGFLCFLTYLVFFFCYYTTTNILFATLLRFFSQNTQNSVAKGVRYGRPKFKRRHLRGNLCNNPLFYQSNQMTSASGHFHCLVAS